MPNSEPYLNDAVLAEMAGRLRFGAQPIEQKIEEMELPQPKPWEYPTHQKDHIAKIFGLRGFEFQALQDEAMAQLSQNEMLQEAYRKFLLIAKLTCNEAVEKVRVHERRVSEDRNKRDRIYLEKKRAYDGRAAKLAKSWSEVRETIRTRWLRMGRSIVKMLEKNASLKTMHERDRVFLEEMVKRGVATVDRSDGAVVYFNWEKFSDFSIEDINEVIHDLNNSSAGNFIRKPTVAPLNEA